MHASSPCSRTRARRLPRSSRSSRSGDRVATNFLDPRPRARSTSACPGKVDTGFPIRTCATQNEVERIRLDSNGIRATDMTEIRTLLRAIVLVGWAAAPQAALPQKLGLLPARFEISPDLAAKVGRRIWLNESGGDERALTVWNYGEDFMSLGIGHFIWFPAGRSAPFEESFPPMLEYLRAKGVRLPNWLDRHPIPPSPWSSRLDFERRSDSAQMIELRAFLWSTLGEQAQFLIFRAQQALPKILSSVGSVEEKERVQRQFERVARASATLYPIVDYVNFKGEGVMPSETFPDKQSGVPQGRGLKQVLLLMTGSAEGQPALE